MRTMTEQRLEDLNQERAENVTLRTTSLGTYNVLDAQVNALGSILHGAQPDLAENEDNHFGA